MKTWWWISLLGVSSLFAGCGQPTPDEVLEAKAPNLAFWKTLGNTTLDINNAEDTFAPDMVMTSLGRPVVAWTESSNIYVKRWTGGTWQQLGGALDMNVADGASNPAVAIDTNDNPVVAWTENQNIYVKRWTGRSWVSYSKGAADAVHALTPDLILDAADHPVIVWQEEKLVGYNLYAKGWDGNSWEFLGSELNVDSEESAILASMTKDSNGNPLVAWTESSDTGTHAYVKFWNGNTWVQIGGAVGNLSYNVSLSKDTQGNPVIAGSEAGGIGVYRWLNDTWTSLGLIAGGSSPSLAWGNNTATVAYVQSSDDKLYVKRWNGSVDTPSWSTIIGYLDVSDDYGTPSLTLNLNRPYVAYSVDDASDGSIKVKYRTEQFLAPHP
jgi:hypothetical protein